MKNPNRPWLNSEGKHLSDNELLKTVKTWGGATWEEFLVSTVEEPLQESLIQDGSSMDQFTSSCRTSYQDMVAADRDYPSLRIHIRALVTKLTFRERAIIYGIFWEGKTQTEIGKSLHISRSTVNKYRDQALKKLGVQMVKKSLMATKLKASRKSDCHPIRDASSL